jgi:hypothetical protein
MIAVVKTTVYEEETNKIGKRNNINGNVKGDK